MLILPVSGALNILPEYKNDLKVILNKKHMDFTAQLIIDLTNDNNQPKYEKIRNKLTKQVNILNNLALYIFIFGCIAFGIYAIANLIYN